MATTGPAFSSGSREQVVTLNLDSSGNLVSVDTDFHISKKDHQEVHWVTNPPNYPFKVAFTKNGSPFGYDNFSDEYPYSGEALRGVPGNDKRWEYTATAGSVSIDPGGTVNP